MGFFLQVTWCALVILAITVCRTSGAAVLQPVEYVITHNNPSVPVEYLDPSRIKRSGSGDILGYVKEGLKAKISQVAGASKGSVAYFSKHSSAHQDQGYHYGEPVSITNRNYFQPLLLVIYSVYFSLFWAQICYNLLKICVNSTLLL